MEKEEEWYCSTNGEKLILRKYRGLSKERRRRLINLALDLTREQDRAELMAAQLDDFDISPSLEDEEEMLAEEVSADGAKPSEFDGQVTITMEAMEQADADEGFRI